MMNLETGFMQALKSRPEYDSLMEDFRESAQKLQEQGKCFFVICNTEDEQRTSMYLEEHGIRDYVFHYNGKSSLRGHALIVIANEGEELSEDAIADAIKTFEKRITPRVPELKSLEEQIKVLDEKKPTIDELENREFLREQHKFALRQSNKFRKK